MFNILRKIFGSSDKLISLSNSTNRKRFVKAFSQTDVWVLSSTFSDFDITDFNEEELTTYIEKTAKNLDEKTNFEPFSYKQNGKDFLPIFSTEKFLETFVYDHIKFKKPFLQVETFMIQGSALGSIITPNTVLVLNDRTEYKYQFTFQEIDMLISFCQK